MEQEESTVTVPLTQGKEALIDARLAAQVLALKWRAHKDHQTYYAWHSQRIGKRQENARLEVSMHRFVFELENGPIPDGWMLDHKNGNGLDNRLSNLRVVTNRQNSSNRERHRQGKYPGIVKKGARYRAQISIKGKRINIGYYATEQEARAAYCRELWKHSPTEAALICPDQGQERKDQ